MNFLPVQVVETLLIKHLFCVIHFAQDVPLNNLKLIEIFNLIALITFPNKASRVLSSSSSNAASGPFFSDNNSLTTSVDDSSSVKTSKSIKSKIN